SLIQLAHHTPPSALSLHDALPISRGEHFGDPSGRLLAVADVDQRADDVAHHVMQKGIRADHEVDLLAGALDGDRMHRPHRRLRLDRKSTRLNSSHQIISYAVFCLK